MAPKNIRVHRANRAPIRKSARPPTSLGSVDWRNEDGMRRFFAGDRSVPLADVCRLANMAMNRVSPLRSGAALPTSSDIVAIARVFGVTNDKALSACTLAIEAKLAELSKFLDGSKA